jgi:acetyltransferase-like isoleucine patch superfamily enzyme
MENSSELEIIISDNASSDGTEDACLGLIDKYPWLVRYSRQSQNTQAEDNMWKALSLGTGDYLKGINDSILFRPGAVDLLMDIVNSNYDSKTPLFFLNGGFGYTELATGFVNIDQLIQHASYLITWWGGYGVWREHMASSDLFCKNKQARLIHTEDYLRQVHDRGFGVAINKDLFLVQNSGRKSGYNIAEVFGRNYIAILKKYVENGQISPETLEVEKYNVLTKHIIPFHFNIGHDHAFHSDEKTLEYLSDFTTLKDFYPIYKQALIAQLSPLSAHFQQTPQSISTDAALAESIRPTALGYGVAATPETWRQKNAHNRTYLGAPIRCPGVSVGNFSYGQINISEYDHPSEGLRIGHFVSIGPEVLFLLGGNHPYKGFSAYPFAVLFFDHPNEADTKGEIVVHDDVCIGYGVTVLSGVSIGQGAVVGAKSVVASDVPPYAIVCGNPARVVKYRFEAHLIEKLQMIDFSRIDGQLLSNLGIAKIYNEVTDNNIDKLLLRLPLHSGL